MKRFGNLYPKIYDLINIELAHHNAKKGKKCYSEVKRVDKEPKKHFQMIHEMLKNKTFHNSKYEVFKKIEGGKEREIFKLPYFPDRIIHHCILQVIEPIWTKSLIADTYACIKGKGIHKGAGRLKLALKDKENTTYCLKGDIKKFYPSVDHDILKRIIRHKIKDVDLLWLLDKIIDSTDGIPIGNYLSQHFGNLYLSDFDHWMKEVQKCQYYFRYCDDFIILHKDKRLLHELRIKMEKYLDDNLRLTLKSNWQIFPIDTRGIDFLGYRFFHQYMLLRKSIAQRIKTKIGRVKKNWKHMRPSEIIFGIMSYYGWMKYANCMNLMKSILDKNLVQIMDKVCIGIGINNPLKNIPGIVV